MNRAMLMLLDQPRKRDETAAFEAGLRAAGFTVHRDIRDPKKGDVLVCWNRQGREHTTARRFEQAGARVLVTENGYLGAKWAGRRWYALAVGHHNGRGMWPEGGPERWDGWGVELRPMRSAPGSLPLILAQRGIGEPDLRPPERWLEEARRRTGGTIRMHPGTRTDGPTLEADLAGRDQVVTWSSGAAIKAMLLGCRCSYGMRGWIGAPAATDLMRPAGDTGPHHPNFMVDRREAMFRRLAWAMFSDAEIAAGWPIERLTC